MKKKILIPLVAILVVLAALCAIGALFVLRRTSDTNPGDSTQTASRHEKDPDEETDPEENRALENDPYLPAEKLCGFSPLVTGKLGDHIYFTDNLLENRNLSVTEEREIVEFLKNADRMLDTDILVTGWSRSGQDDRLVFYAYQYINGAAVLNVHSWTGYTDYFETNGDMPPLADLDTSDLTDLEALAEEVERTAQKHTSEMLMENTGRIYGTYCLECDISFGLYYSFLINEYSEIKADAKTGEIIDEYYFNGEYTD